MNEVLSIETAQKLANYDKLVAENTTLKSDNLLLKNMIKKREKEYLQQCRLKDIKIRELEDKISKLESKQIDMFESEVN